MGEYSLTHFHVGKYKKEDKMAAQMSKELQKAVKAKSKEVTATIANEKVIFRNKENELILADIAKLRKNSDCKIVVAATKVRPKQSGQIFAMRFSDEKKFNEFYNFLNDVCSNKEKKKPEPAVTTPASKPAHSEQRTGTPSAQPSRTGLSSSDLSSTTVTTKIATTIDDESDSTASPQKEKRISSSHSCSRSGYAPLQRPVQKQCNLRAASYVTTDTLAKHRPSRSPKRTDRVSAKDIYPLNGKVTKNKDKNNLEMNTLKYVPGKGMIKTAKNNGYLYSTKKRSASTCDSLYSTPPSLPLTPAKYTFMNAQHSRKGKNRASSHSSSSSSDSTNSSSSNSNSSLPSSILVAEEVNVWKYRSRDASNSTTSSEVTETNTLDEPIVRRKSRYGRCPTCHQRIGYTTRKQ
ncbi:unnamed protein product [Taenia asiatica]|uniref:DUF5734 domain-containing protein n=1 Tax=Taenia asiatica TaxID=60517 RepID=A0A0R3W7H8_TAEAS|nr:unnamed protein product [Taenia asiatica]